MGSDDAMKSVLESSELQNAAQQAAIPAYLPPAQLATLAEESVAWRRLINEPKIAAE